MDNVVAEEKLVLEDVPNESAEKRDIAARRESAPRCRRARSCARTLDRHE